MANPRGAGDPFRILFLTSESPYPPIGGGRLRDMHVLSLLKERARDVEVLCFQSPAPPDSLAGADGHEAPSGVRVTAIPRDRAPIWRRIIYPLRPYVVNGFSRNMAAALRQRAPSSASAGTTTVLWVSRLAMAQYIPLARELGYRVVLDEHNVESHLLLNAAYSSIRRWPGTLIAAQCKFHEARFCAASDAVVATSDIDAAKLQKLAPRVPIHVIPNSVDSTTYASGREGAGRTLFFSGTLSYGPNIEGLEWFAREVMPRLRAAMGAQLPPVVAAGANPPPGLAERLAAAGIQVRANPPSMLPYLAEASVVFVPLRSGSGTRLKILEAMAAGKPVVSTGKGAEGLVLTPASDIFIADQPDGFTTALVKLLRDPSLRESVGRSAARTVEARYDWRCARPLIEHLLSSLPVHSPLPVQSE